MNHKIDHRFDQAFILQLVGNEMINREAIEEIECGADFVAIKLTSPLCPLQDCAGEVAARRQELIAQLRQ